MFDDPFSSKSRFAILFGTMTLVFGIAISFALGSWMMGLVVALALASQVRTLAR
jgi:hypothetical protein